MTKNTTPEATRTITAVALDAELGRRRNNKARKAKGEPTVRAAAFFLPALSTADITAIKAGEVVTVEFHSGRVERIGLKVNAD